MKHKKKSKMTDEEFMEYFLKLPYGNTMTAEEEKKVIRESHYFDPDRKINHIWDRKK